MLGLRRLVQPVGEHPVPVGPLAVRWVAYELPELRAGAMATARVRLENAGSATWRSRDGLGVQASHHWLDDLGNALEWDGLRTPLPHPVAPGETVELELALRPLQPPGLYRLAFDLLEENRFWFSEVGVWPLEVEVRMLPRIEERRLAVAIRGGANEEIVRALAAQEEPLVEEGAVATAYLVAGATPAPDWSRRILDAHAEGYVAVGGAIESREPKLRPWAASGAGRNPAFAHPLLLPSLLGSRLPVERDGLPAYEAREEPWLFDGRIVVRLSQPRARRLIRRGGT